jgi:hypothetical protein
MHNCYAVYVYIIHMYLFVYQLYVLSIRITKLCGSQTVDVILWLSVEPKIGRRKNSNNDEINK